jgi:hypothetical protein
MAKPKGQSDPMNGRRELPQATSTKQQLVASIARGNELAAEEIRLLLKINAPEKWGKRNAG